MRRVKLFKNLNTMKRLYNNPVQSATIKGITKISTFIIFMLLSSSIFAQTISLQGVLRDPNGKSVEDGFYDVTFTVYDQATAGTALWTENYPSMQTIHGVFNANLGSVSPLEPSLAFDAQYYVGITVSPYPEMTPRLEITIYPYAKAILGQDNKFPSVGNVEMAADDFIITEGSLRIQGASGAIVFNDGTSLNTANFGGPAGSLANPTDAVVNADQDINGSGAINFQIGGTTRASLLNNGEFSIGNDDVTRGFLSLYGDTGSGGGQLRLYNDALFDDTNEFWFMESTSGNFRIGEISTNFNRFNLNADGSASFSGGLTLGTNLTSGTVAGLNTVLNSNQLAANNAGSPSTLFLNFADGDVNIRNGEAIFSTGLASFTGGTSAGSFVQSGSNAGLHVNVLPSSIQAYNAAAASILNLNPNGGEVSVGQVDVNRGGLKLYGNATDGGYVIFENGADDDATNNHFALTANDGSFQLYNQSIPLFSVAEAGAVNAISTISVGSTAGLHVLTNVNNVQARNGSDTSRLHLNFHGGSVNIGNVSNDNAKLVVSGGTNLAQTYTSFLDNATAGFLGTASLAFDYSIDASNRIIAEAYMVRSDERIKDIIGISNSAKDIDILNKIKITDYTLKDKIAFGNIAYKKVIAQQVREVYPAAISFQKEFIPNIYKASQKIGFDQESELLTITVQNHELQKGDFVKLFFDQGEEHLLVEEVVNEHSFKVSYDKAVEKLFVFGKQVDDFHVVDYEAIAMLNVSATQELAKQVKVLQKKNAELKAKMGKMDALEAKLNLLLGLQDSTGDTQIAGQ